MKSAVETRVAPFIWLRPFVNSCPDLPFINAMLAVVTGNLFSLNRAIAAVWVAAAAFSSAAVFVDVVVGVVVGAVVGVVVGLVPVGVVPVGVVGLVAAALLTI